MPGASAHAVLISVVRLPLLIVVLLLLLKLVIDTVRLFIFSAQAERAAEAGAL